MAEGSEQAARPAPGRAVWRYLPIAVVAIAAGAAVAFGGDALGFAALERNYDALQAWRAANPVLVAAAFVTVYAVAVAVSLPGAVWLTILGGLLFGTALGAALVVVAATTGATLIFLAARTALGNHLRDRASGWLARLERGFRRDEVSFLLIMRLVPAVPFFIANLAPAFLGARLQTFVWTTFVGIIPATIVYAWIGAGLGVEIAKGVPPDLGLIFEPHVLGPLLGLAALAALPMALRRLGLRRP
ncbi:MAG: TVP38/TMEM64 family protein [Pikeienuella sp.]